MGYLVINRGDSEVIGFFQFPLWDTSR